MKGIRGIWKRKGLNKLPILRKVMIAVIGTSILLIGLVLIVLPGPASLVIPIGLGILATEFLWARRIWRRGRIIVEKARRGAKAAKARVAEKIP